MSSRRNHEEINENCKAIGENRPRRTTMNVKTSITDPIEVAEVIPQHYPGYYPGKIGISLCPGKKGPSSFGGVWDRDLATDLSVIKRDFGATAIVTFRYTRVHDLIHWGPLTV